MTLLDLKKAHELFDLPEEGRWLVKRLWGDQAVGIVGGEPKCCKSFLALDMAVAVATGTPCLRHFPVPQMGRVLLFAAEDAQHIVRRRLESIARAAEVCFEKLDIQVITTPTLRLDVKSDRQRLTETIQSVRPKLLVLDPFVRLHRIDENAAAEVAPLLGYLRELQRRFHIAILLVHHAKKGASHARAGQALRGSSEIHAWGDSNLYLRRKNDDLLLTIEHRAAPSGEGIHLELHEKGKALALQVVDKISSKSEPGEKTIHERIRQVLADAKEPMSLRGLRKVLKIRMESLCQALKVLRTEGYIRKGDQGYRLDDRNECVSVSRSSIPSKGNGNRKQLNLPGETESGAAGTQPGEG
ncbi:MAG: AAA family ATPase [Candidatus Eisenbacteria bacterium]|nr:AAA family ATPase [Planctomycetota bacterium]MBU1698564.1 AAA family ATPase [Candidatus Eisenbacteria bacterium]